MSLKLKQRITQYLNKNSKLKIAGDIFFLSAYHIADHSGNEKGNYKYSKKADTYETPHF